MKRLIDKYFKRNGFNPLWVLLADIVIISYVIFPGLSAPNSMYNVISLILFLVLFVFNYYYFKFDNLFKDNFLN